jgi:DDE superfamily endonuclease./Tc5 transposase DNA-binding domain./CENP-B N-terminal DNA-binding domain.
MSKQGTAGKRKHVTLTIPQKLEIINRLESGESRSVVMAAYNIGSSTIYDIRKQKDQLRSFLASSENVKDLLKRQTLKQPKLAQLDKVLYTWFTTMRSEGKPVTGPLIIEKAKSFYDEMKITEKCTFSEGWLRNFKQRHGIRKRDVSGKVMSADVEAAERYSELFHNLVEQNKLLPTQIYNANETVLFWRCLPNSTAACAMKKTAKCSKLNRSRVTVLLCANADGSHKMKLFVVGKFKKPRSFKNTIHLPVIYNRQGHAWMTAELFKDWFFNHFVPAVKENFGEQGLPDDSNAVLLLDNCGAYPPASELVCGNIFATYLPANVKSFIQPMDQGVIQNFKQFYRRTFVQRLVYSDCSVHDFQASFSLKDAIYAAALAWKDVKADTIRKAWRALWPASMFLDDSSDEEFEGFNIARRSSKEILAILSDASETNLLGKLTEDDVEDWIDADKELPVAEEFTDEQLIQSASTPDMPEVVDAVEEDDEEGPKKIYTWKQATEFISKFVEFAESNSHYTAAEVMNLHVLLNTFYQKRASAMKQADLRDMFKKASKSVCTSTCVVPPDPLSAATSNSPATIIPDPQSPGPAPFLVKTDETPENTEGDSDANEPAAEGDIKMEYSSD